MYLENKNWDLGGYQQLLGRAIYMLWCTHGKQQTPASHLYVCCFRAQSLILQYSVLLTTICLISETHAFNE